MTKAYPYVRFSSDHQKDGHSLQRQTEAIERYLAENPQLVVDKSLQLEDLGKSGYRGQNIEKGAALHLFLSKAESGEIDFGSVLIVESFNRLSRLPLIDAMTLFQRILQLGIDIAVLDENHTFKKADINSIDYLRAILKFELANKESKYKSEKGIDNWKRKKERLRNAESPDQERLSFTRTIPKWLKIENNKILIDEEKAQTIRKIFEYCADENLGIMKIAKIANERKWPRLDNTSNAWTFDIIKRLIHNRALIGEYQPRKTVKLPTRKRPSFELSDEPPILDVYPSVISHELFNKVQVRSHDRKLGGGGKRSDTPNLFTKLLQCSECGGSVRLQKNHNGYKEYRYLKCNNSLYGHCVRPGVKSWPYDDFKKVFFEHAGTLNLEELFEETNELVFALKIEMTSWEGKRIEINNKIVKIIKIFEDGENISKSLNDLLIKLESEREATTLKIQEIKHQLVRLDAENLETNLNNLAKIKNLLEKSNSCESTRNRINAQLRELISKIYIDFTSKCMDIEFKSGVLRAIFSKGVFANIPPTATGEQRERDLQEIYEWNTLSIEEKKERYAKAGLDITPLPIPLNFFDQN